MVVKSFLVAMCRWRSTISHWRAILLMALLSAVQVSSQQPTYIFSESNIPVRICPVVVASDVNPSLVIRPSSSTDAFLTGQFTYPTSGTTSERFIFPPPCNDSPCTELSIRYNPSSPPARDSFNVGYAGSGGSGQATIQIDYATKGIYLQKPGVVLRPVDGSENLDQGMLVYLGDLSPPFITCHVENQTEARVVVAINIGGYEKCATSVGGGGQPTFLELRYDPGLAMGTHRLYTAAEGNCSSDQRSEEFIVSFESPPPTTPEPGVTTTSSTDGTVDSGNNTGQVIGGVVGGVLFLLLLVVLVAVLAAVIGVVCYRHNHANERGKNLVENGISASNVHGNEDATRTTDQNGIGNGYPTVRHSLECIYVGGKHYKALDESLADCHDVELRRLDDSDVKLIRAIVSKNKCIVYIIQDSGSVASPFIKELESMPGDKNHRKNVFLILFKSEEQHTIKRQYHCILTRREDPSNDASSCAKTIVDEVQRIRGDERQQDSPDPSRTDNVTDGMVIHVHVNVTGDQKGGDQDKDKYQEYMEKGFNKLEEQMHKGFTTVEETVDKAEKIIREEIGVVHDELEHHNETANGKKVAVAPIVPQ